jgi:hypothetical protein
MSVHHYSKDLIEALHTASVSGEIACAAAMKVAAEQKASPADIGKALDIEEINIVKCQLGLFGYKPEKKIVLPASSVSEDLKREISDGLADGRLPCDRAWAIAEKMRISKMDIAAACEALGIKIKPCQLGAF